ncbi:Do family serine endopeptidase [bacterium]|nr:Do family serine endopeptidase [bacterium]MDB4770898.1 Do family serine endopeptidase [bacterium]
MTKTLKQAGLAFTTMIMGSLIATLIFMLPTDLRTAAQAQNRTSASVGARPPVVNAENLQYAQSLSDAFHNVAETLRPCVVSISTKQIVSDPRMNRVQPQFRYQFGPREQNGMGSGVIVRPDGYILTNNHVIEGADSLTVELSDGQTVSGTVVGADPQTDLAVVKIDAPNLRAAAFGNSDATRVGDWVLAIGSPFGLDQTVTAGIISGKNRVQAIIADGDGFEDFLQTDAAINPGNSGGPLVNLRGELIGINTAILSQSGASAGIGFAIPVSMAEPVLRSIIENGEVRRGFLGAQVVDVSPELKEKYDLRVRGGALVATILPGQSADLAGLRVGDVVTRIDGRLCTGGTQLRNFVASRPPESTVRMEINRNGKNVQIRVRLTERTDEAMAGFRPDRNDFGSELIPVTPDSQRRYGYRGLQGGLIVTSVDEGSLADQADLEVGDVIESVGGLRIRTVDQLAEILVEAKRGGQAIRMIVRRGRERLTLLIR